MACERSMGAARRGPPPESPHSKGAKKMTIEHSQTMTTVSTEHTIRRLQIRLGRSFEDAVTDFERIVPPIEPQRFHALKSWEDNVRLFEAEAPLGLMRFA